MRHRSALLVLSVAVLMVAAGCTTATRGGDAAPEGPPSVDEVPEGAEFVVSYDSSVVNDPATKSVANTYLNQSTPPDSDQPRTVEGYLEQVRNDTEAASNLSVEAVGGVVAFGQIPEVSGFGNVEGDVYFGLLIRTSWETAEVVDSLRQNATVTEETYRGVTLYVVEQNATDETDVVGDDQLQTVVFANYGENRWVAGTDRAVRDVVDVAEGEADPLSGDLREAYDDTREDGFVRFAAAVPERQTDRAPTGGFGGSGIDNLTHVSGSYYTEGGQDGSVGLRTKLHTTSEDSASDLQETIDGALSLLAPRVEEEALEEQLDRISVEREGTVVTVSFESPVEQLNAAIREFVDPTLGPGDQASVPQAALDFEYADGTVTVTHAGGDTLEGERIAVRCGGRLAEDSYRDERYAAGDTVAEVDCSPGETVRVIWSAPDGSRTEVLASFRVPEEGGAAALAPAVAP